MALETGLLEPRYACDPDSGGEPISLRGPSLSAKKLLQRLRIGLGLSGTEIFTTYDGHISPPSLCCISLSLCPAWLLASCWAAAPWVLCWFLPAARSSLCSFCTAGGIPSYLFLELRNRLTYVCYFIVTAPFNPEKCTGQDHPCVNNDKKIQVREDELPKVAPTKHHKLGWLRQQKCTVSRFWRPEV